MSQIKIAIAGVGNCASSLVQGIHYYKDKRPEDAIGVMHWDIGGFRPGDIEVVAAFDIDKRKVGKDVNEAIFAPPNCARAFYENLPVSGTTVHMGRILDGFSAHMREYEDKLTFVPANLPEPDQADVVRILKDCGAEVLLNYMPVGSEQAACFYAECALAKGQQGMLYSHGRQVVWGCGHGSGTAVVGGRLSEFRRGRH
jgi:myo-inositol-1-phosphate synthase